MIACDDGGEITHPAGGSKGPDVLVLRATPTPASARHVPRAADRAVGACGPLPAGGRAQRFTADRGRRLELALPEISGRQHAATIQQVSENACAEARQLLSRRRVRLYERGDLANRCLEEFRLRRARRLASRGHDDNTFEAFGPHDGAQAAAPHLAASIIDDAREEHSVLAGSSNDRRFTWTMPPLQSVKSGSCVETPEISGRTQGRAGVLHDDVYRTLGRPLDDQIIEPTLSQSDAQAAARVAVEHGPREG